MGLKTIVLKWITVIGVGLLAASACVDKSLALETLKEKVSYGIGVDMAKNFKCQGIEADVNLVMKGLTDELGGEKLLVPEEELRMIMTAFQHELNKRQMMAMKAAAEENKKQGEAFLSENAKKEGVVALPSGLQYKILKKGAGKNPTEADMVECNFRGTLLSGTELDSSPDGKPASFKVTAVIPGWKEALQLMPAGSKWQLFIPSHLAYGENGADGRIGPNQTLIFEVELISISASKS